MLQCTTPCTNVSGMENKVPTAAELDTLATLIYSAGRHMATARQEDGNRAVPYTAMNAIYRDAVDGFYDIQLRAPGGLTRELRVL